MQTNMTIVLLNMYLFSVHCQFQSDLRIWAKKGNCVATTAVTSRGQCHLFFRFFPRRASLIFVAFFWICLLFNVRILFENSTFMLSFFYTTILILDIGCGVEQSERWVRGEI